MRAYSHREGDGFVRECKVVKIIRRPCTELIQGNLKSEGTYGDVKLGVTGSQER